SALLISSHILSHSVSSLIFLFSFSYSRDLRDLHSFPTRRSSDLLLNKSPVDLFNDLVNTRKQFREQLNRPFFQSFCHNGMVCIRSEEHTSELQSRFDLVCRLLLEKKNKNQINVI